MLTIFVIMCITSFFASIINPTLTTSYLGQISLFFGIEITLFALYNSIRYNGLADIIFLLALLGYLTGGVGLIGYLDVGISIYGFFTGNTCLILVFEITKPTRNKDQSTISNYFSIQRELEQTKTALGEREQTFQTLFNQMADPVMILDRKGKFIELTSKVKDYTGYEKEEILGKNFLTTKLLTPKSKAVCVENLMKRMAGADVKPYEVEALTKDGKKIPFEVNAQRIIYNGKKADLVVFRDISARKEIQEKLKESKKTLADIIENSPIPMFVIDKNHQVTHWNQALLKLTAISPEKMIGTSNHWQAFYPQKRPLIADFVVDEANEKTISNFYDGKYKKSLVEHSFEAEDFFPHMQKQGKWLHFSASPLKDEQDNVVGAIEILQDITERKQVQQKEKKLLEKSLFLSKTANELNQFSAEKDIIGYVAERIEEIAGNCLISLYTYDIKTHQFSIKKVSGHDKTIDKLSKFVSIDFENFSATIHSKRYEQMLRERKLHKITNQELKEIIMPNFPWGSYLFAKNLFNIDQIYLMGIEHKGKLFGGIMIMANKKAVVENKDMIEIFCNQAATTMQRNSAMKELSEMNQHLEEKVKKRTERIEKLLKQKDQFVNQLGHDLKNPLGPLTNLVPLVKKHTPNQEDKHMLEVVERNVGYMRNLVDKTLELARLNSPNVNIQFEPVNLHSLFDQVLDTNHYLFEDQNIAVEQHIPEDIAVVGDTIRLEELITNLLNNSVKYSPDGGIISITVEKDAENKNVTMSVADEGIGMNEEEINQVFDEFYKADGSRHDFDSSGLGMPICKRIVEIHNGRIWVESPGHGKGSTFYVTLPLDQKQKQQKKAVESSKKYQSISEKIDHLLQ